VTDRVERCPEYNEWFEQLSEQQQRIVETRIDPFRNLGLLIGIKPLARELGLFEFKWRSGLRVYFSIFRDAEGRLLLLLIGGNKNSQPKDINLAKKIARRRMHEKKEDKSE